MDTLGRGRARAVTIGLCRKTAIVDVNDGGGGSWRRKVYAGRAPKDAGRQRRDIANHLHANDVVVGQRGLSRPLNDDASA